MIGLSTYVCIYIYILNLPFCTNVYSTSLLNGTKKYIEIETKRISITYPEKKGFDEPILWVVFKRDYHKIHSFLCINCQTTPVLREKKIA